MKKILVTGGAGFIGSNFIYYWLKTHPEDEIINFDALTYAGNLENLSGVQDSSHYHFVKGDIRNEKEVEAVLDNVDTVVHFAAESHVDRSILEPTVFVETNVLGTQVLLEVSLRRKVKRFHHISTDEVYGSLNLHSKLQFDENSPFRPNSPYAASKAGADCLVRAYYKTYGLPITITNTSNNYGPYQFPEKLIPLAITNIIEGKKVPVYGNGENIRDWLYVEDHCRAIDLVLERGKIGETYCIGGNGERSNYQVIKTILEIMKKDESCINFIKDRQGHDKRYGLNFAKVTQEIGYNVETGFEQYLEKTVHWYLKHENWWKSVKSGEYQRYYEKQYGNREKTA